MTSSINQLRMNMLDMQTFQSLKAKSTAYDLIELEEKEEKIEVTDDPKKIEFDIKENYCEMNNIFYVAGDLPSILNSIEPVTSYIFSDVDGIYSADPNMITMAKRLNEISFDEMQEIADAGAKVLHNRCVEIGKKYNVPIYVKSTFEKDSVGTLISENAFVRKFRK